jgi:hypothetical protein
MNIIKRVLVFTALYIVLNSVYAVDVLPGQEQNGCGTEGIQGILVPDSTIFSNCKFNNACNIHDLCYGRCLKGGDLHGQDICNDPIAKESRRKSCDTTFFNNIVHDNDERGICEFYGKIYRFAVVNLGKGNFNGKEIENMASLAFSKGQVEADKFYTNLLTVQKTEFSPQTLFLDEKNNILLKQQDKLLKFNHNQLNEMANIANALGQ